MAITVLQSFKYFVNSHLTLRKSKLIFVCYILYRHFWKELKKHLCVFVVKILFINQLQQSVPIISVK